MGEKLIRKLREKSVNLKLKFYLIVDEKKRTEKIICTIFFLKII